MSVKATLIEASWVNVNWTGAYIPPRISSCVLEIVIVESVNVLAEAMS
jgi:hypothetical protein